MRKDKAGDIAKDMQQLWKEVDRGIAKYGEMSEQEIQAEIEKYRVEKPRSKSAKRF